uniref:Cysteine sulfinic acid decarboxylase n=1 Tax=Theropithecus gelada TaxID=9565 RepID=A0A8D2EP61_THEGE
MEELCQKGNCLDLPSQEWKKGAEILWGFCAQWAGPKSSHFTEAARLGWRKAQGPLLDASVAGRNRTGSAHTCAFSASARRADSVAWNPHKLLAAGLQCSALLLQDTSNLLKRCHGSQASYLFQQDKFYDVALDTGDKVVQCGRRVDCLKLWLMWKAQGDQGLERRIDQAFALARYLVEEIKKREGLELVMEPEFVNVCFWFVPPSLRGKQDSPDYHERLSKVAPVLKERMVKEGSMMIGYQPHGTRGNFFRVVVANPALTCADMDFLLNELERLGQDL